MIRDMEQIEAQIKKMEDRKTELEDMNKGLAIKMNMDKSSADLNV